MVNPFIWTAIDMGDGKWYLRNWGSGSAGASIGNGIVVDQGKLKVLNVGCKWNSISFFFLLYSQFVGIWGGYMQYQSSMDANTESRFFTSRYPGGWNPTSGNRRG